MNDICYNINTGYDESDEFVCSNCGIQLRGWYSIEQYPDGDIEYNDYIIMLPQSNWIRQLPSKQSCVYTCEFESRWECQFDARLV